MSDIISRSYDNATFIYDRKYNKSIFFEGELAKFAFEYFNNSKYSISDNFFDTFEEQDKKYIIEDINNIKKIVDDFIMKNKNLSNSLNTISDENDSMKELTTYARNNWQITLTSIELTSHCNLRCEMCYIDDFTNKGLSFDELEKLAHNLKNQGVIFISFTGGEIFTRKDTVDIILMYYKLGFIIEIKTNALLLNQETIQKLSQINILDFQISIYEIDDMYSSYTKTDYKFSKLKENLKYLLKYNIPITLSILVGRHNIDMLVKINNELTKIGVTNIFYSPYITPNRGGSNKKAENYRLTYLELEDKFKPFLRSINGFSEVNKYRDCNSSNVICNAGIDQIVISSNGDIYPCLDFNLVMGNIKDQSIDKMLEKRFSLLESYKMQNLSKCMTCDIRDYCDSCIGVALMENKNYQEPITHKCDISRFYYSNARK